MKRIHILVLACVSSLVLFFACRKQVDVRNPPDFPGSGPDVQVTATIQGRVTDPDGNPVMSATVTSGTATAQTDVNGIFRFVGIQTSRNFGFVKVSKTGFFNGSRTFITSTSGSNYVRIELLKRTYDNVISSVGPVDITTTDGCKLQSDDFGVINTASNAAYSGDVRVYQHWIDPTDSKLSGRMPGDLRGIDSANATVALKTYGMIAVELEGTGGEKLQIAPGKQMTISMPIPASLQGTAPNTIPLWYFNDTTGKWIEQGYASKQGSYYTGTVTHFTYWNADIPSGIVYFHLNLQDQHNNPLAFTQLDITDLALNNTRTNYSDSAGVLEGWIPKNTALSFVVRSSCGDALLTQAEGPFTSDQDLGTFTVNVPASNMLTVHGAVVDCSNGPVANGFASITLDGLTYGAAVKNGSFSATILRCSSGPGQIALVVGDLTANVQSAPAFFDISGNDLNTGQAQACGTELDQYIYFSISGAPYSITIPPDSIVMQVASYAYIDGASRNPGTDNFKQANFQVPIAAIGNANLSWAFFMTGHDSYYNKAADPVQCSISEFDDPGGYVKGTFSGNIYKDSTGTALPVTGSFKVKR
jgi:hypothetical protein